MTSDHSPYTNQDASRFACSKAIGPAADLTLLFAETIRALTVLDADGLEALAESLGANLERIRLPSSPGEWARLRSQHRVLGHLLAGTGQRLRMLQQISSAPAGFGSYAAAALLSPRTSAMGDLAHRRSSRFDPAN